jgi:CheY-like chemotaxis protein
MEPFFTTKGVGKGTGLGLPMVSGLAEQSGGRLFLQSRVGEGTTAELWLPLAPPTAIPVVDRRLQPTGGPERPPGRSLTVLAVDDDALVLTNTAAMLEELGHRVFVASSGKQALEILGRENGVDLVVTDQAMPGMTGSQLAEAVRSRWPDTRLILATGYAELAPGTGVALPRLSKPFGQRELSEAIGRLIDGVGSAG